METIKSNKTVIILGILLALAAGYIYYLHSSKSAPVGTTVIATQATEVKGKPTEDVVVPKVKVIKVNKKDLSLPKDVITNDKQRVVASSKISPSYHPKTLTTLIDTDTGAFSSFERTDPLPWFELVKRGEIGVYVGMKNGEQAARLQGRYDFVQVKAVHFGVTGSIDRMQSGKSDAFIGVGGAWKFD